MRRTVFPILGALLIAGQANQAPAASERQVRQTRGAPVAIGEQFRNASDSIGQRARGWCSEEPGNPYNEQTDYAGWSAWRQLGAWNSRNDCQ
jgi:hypothetical protein